MDERLTLFLASHGVEYVLHKHPAVFTCDEVKELPTPMPGLPNKNLFLRDDAGAYYLLILPASKRLNTARFRHLTGAKGVRFASEDELQSVMGLRKGGVTPLGLVFDAERQVRVLIDEDIWNADVLGFHPEVNCETLELSQQMFRTLLTAVSCTPRIVAF
jgi:Ala-tRNA(Pro) deacylase